MSWHNKENKQQLAKVSKKGKIKRPKNLKQNFLKKKYEPLKQDVGQVYTTVSFFHIENQDRSL